MNRSTHTLAELELPFEIYRVIRKKLLDAGYNHAIDVDGPPGAGMLDMNGIGITLEPLGSPSGPANAFATDNLDLLQSGHASLGQGPPM